MRQRRALSALAQGFWLSFVVGLLSAPWVAFAAQEFLEVSAPVSIVVLLLFAATCAQPHLLLFAPLLHWSHGRALTDPSIGRTVVGCFGLACLYTGLDTATPRLFDVGLGYALHSSPSLRQAADLGGVPILTGSIVLVNLLLWRALVLLRSRSERAMVAVPLLMVGATLAALVAYGSVRNREILSLIEKADATLEVGVVQGNVANEVRLRWARGDERAAEEQLSAYTLPTDELAQETQDLELIVWPEATFPGVFMQPRSTLQRGRANKLDRQLLRLNRPIVFGAYDLESSGSQPVLYNALFAVTPRYDDVGAQGRVQRYRKHRLLPFAETIPGITKNEWLARNLPSLGFFGAGEGPRVLEIETPNRSLVNLGPIICSESLSSRHVIETVRQGAEVLVNIGSDGWFGPWGEPQFHLAVARMRSVESRRPQIRAANTGISALILPNGEIADRSELGSTATLRVSVPLMSPIETTALRWGDWFGWASLVAGIATILFMSLRTRASVGAAAS